MPLPIRAEGVRVRYGERLALDRVDLEVPEGQFLALAGPNGSGKTTLLRAILGLIEPDEGRIEVAGTPVRALAYRERARRMAWVPQEEPLRDDVPLLRYVLYGRYARLGRFDAESAADYALARAVLAEVGLEDREGDGVASISGGERQRATLARALAQEAPILLLDEPTAHLDIGHQLDFLSRARRRARPGHTTVVSALHDLNLAARYADRIVVLSRGRVVADGPPATVLSEDLLARVWGIDARRIVDPRTHGTFLLPIRWRGEAEVPAAPPGAGPIHVVGGGGSAAELLRALVGAGYRTSLGAVHLFDSDSEAAEELAIPAAVELPFAPMSEAVRERSRALARAARLIVVAPFPAGPGNVTNLEDLVGLEPGPPVVLVEPPDPGTLDFVEGRATRARAALRRAGAVSVPDSAAALREVAARLPASGSPVSSGGPGTERHEGDRR